MMKYDLIIFDFDGTLADTYSWFTKGINLAAGKYDFKVLSETEMEVLRGKKTQEIIRYLGISWWKLPFIARYMRRLMEEEVTNIELFPGIRELLIELKSKQINIAILSSNSTQNIERILGPELIGTIIHFECGASIYGKKKKLIKILKKFMVHPEKVLAIGDETRDVEAARSLGITAGAVSWGYSTVFALENENPDFIFSDVSDLLKVL